MKEAFNEMSSKKLKIGFVFDDSLDSADGVAQYVKTLGAWFSAQGHEVFYLVGETKITQWSGGKVYSLAKNIKVRFNGNKLSIPAFSNRRQIKKVLAREDFDILHVQVPYSPLLAARIINLAPPSMAIIGTFHIFPAGWLSRGGSRLLKLALVPSIFKFDKMLSVSSASASFANGAYGLKPEVLPNAVETSRFRVDNEVEQADIVFLGRLVERKGCKQLLKAFKILHNELPEVGLKIAGAGPLEKSLKEYVVANDLSGNVEFLGFVSEEEKARLLAGATVACFPSLYGEAFGIVLIEAMAAGAGVVLGGDNPGYRSVLGGKETLLINPRNPRALADRLKLLLGDKQLAAKLHQWQTESVKQYDVNVVGAKLLDIYRASIDIKNKNEHNKA